MCDQALLLGTQGVAKNFKDIFAQLAPGGSAQLVMQKRLRQQEPSEEAEDGAPPEATSTADRYSGVKVKVTPALPLYAVETVTTCAAR